MSVSKTLGDAASSALAATPAGAKCVRGQSPIERAIDPSFVIGARAGARRGCVRARKARTVCAEREGDDARGGEFHGARVER